MPSPRDLLRAEGAQCLARRTYRGEGKSRGGIAFYSSGLLRGGHADQCKLAHNHALLLIIVQHCFGLDQSEASNH